MNTTENNKIIAEFMGFYFDRFHNDGIIEPPINTMFFKHSATFSLEELKFNSDWNWIMEVVEKIKPLVYAFDICKSGTIIFQFKENNTLPSIAFNNRNMSQIETVYNSCIEFIKWHNEQNK
jgi:hypothetical protein